VQITTRQLAKCEGNSGVASKKQKLSRQPGECLFFSLIDSSSPDPQLFSDLASKNSLLLARLVSVWKKLVHTPVHVYPGYNVKLFVESTAILIFHSRCKKNLHYTLIDARIQHALSLLSCYQGNIAIVSVVNVNVRRLELTHENNAL
jgi:hypothetical protein